MLRDMDIKSQHSLTAEGAGVPPAITNSLCSWLRERKNVETHCDATADPVKRLSSVSYPWLQLSLSHAVKLVDLWIQLDQFGDTDRLQVHNN